MLVRYDHNNVAGSITSFSCKPSIYTLYVYSRIWRASLGLLIVFLIHKMTNSSHDFGSSSSCPNQVFFRGHVIGSRSPTPHVYRAKKSLIQARSRGASFQQPSRYCIGAELFIEQLWSDNHRRNHDYELNSSKISRNFLNSINTKFSFNTCQMKRLEACIRCSGQF
jgi:hypothetical protein